MQKINLNEKCEITIRVPSDNGIIANRIYFRDGVWHLDEIDENYDCSVRHFTSSVFKSDEECTKLSETISALFKNNCGLSVSAVKN